MHATKKFLLGTCAALSFGLVHAAAPVASLTTDAIINLPLGTAWALFTTDAGLNSMGYAPAKIDLQMGGKLRAEQAGGEPIDAEIASYEPERMLALKREGGWSVLYFQAMGREMTGLRWVELATEKTPSLQTLAQTHRALFDRLIRRYAPECELCKKEREAAEATPR